MTPSAAKGTRLDFTRSLRMASVATPPAPLSELLLYFSCYILNDVFYMFHLCEAFDVGTGEEETMLDVTEYSVCEGLCDAVFRFCRITYRDAAVTVRRGDTAFLLHPLEEWCIDRSSRHADGALNDAEIFRLRMQEYILIGLGGIALIDSDETGGELHASRTGRLHCPKIVVVPDATCSEDRDRMACCFFKWFQC